MSENEIVIIHKQQQTATITILSRTQILILLLAFTERNVSVLGTVDYDDDFDNYYFLFMFYRSVDEHVTTIV